MDLAVVGVLFVQIRVLAQCLFDGDPECIGDHLGDFIDPRERHIESSSDVADGGLGLECPEGPDLCNVVFAVLFFRVVDDSLSAISAEVDIDIGWFVAAGIEEPFEQQVVLQRADVAESEQVGDECSAGRPTCLAGDVFFHCEPDKVPHDQEVARVPHLFDDLQLDVESIGDVAGHVVPVAPLESILAQFPQVDGVGLSCGRFEDREVSGGEVEIDVDSVCDVLSQRDGIVVIGERVVHFRSRLDEELVPFHLHPSFVGNDGPRVDAQQHVMGFGVAAIEVVRVVGGDQWDAGLA